MTHQADNTSLIWLRDIGKDHVHHTNKHAVAQWVAGILDYWDDVRSVSGHIDKISTRSMRELDGKDCTGGADNIGDV